MSKFFSKITTLQTLSYTAIGAGVLTVGGGLYFQSRIQANFKNQEFFQKSVELLAGYPPAQRTLGAPIKAKNIDIGNWTKNYTDGLKAQFEVPVKGSRGSGVLFSWASRARLGDSWNIDRMDIELNDQRWTFYRAPTSEENTAAESSATDSASKAKESSLGPLRYINK